MKVGVCILSGMFLVAMAARAVERRAISVKESDFSKEQLAKLAKKALKDSPNSLTVVSFFGAGGGPPLPKPSHYDFDQWRRMCEMAAMQKAQVAEAISVGGNAVLRIRQADGSISRQILSGEDPLKLTLAGNTFEIIYFDFSGPSRLGLQDSVFVFVRAHSPFDVTAGSNLFKKLAPLFPGLGVAVEVRNDAWFVYQQRYPFYNPFNQDRDIPSQREYERSPTMKCTGNVDTPHCEITNP